MGAIGMIRSRGGVEAGVRKPFQQTEIPVLNRPELYGEGFDFWPGRHYQWAGVLRQPNYTAGSAVTNLIPLII